MDNADSNTLIDRLQSLLDRLEPHLPAVRNDSPDDHALAHRWTPERGFIAVHSLRLMQRSELLGLEDQADTLWRNTRQFLHGQPANHALLWGARGTGKSSLVRALLSDFAGQGLRLVEMTAHTLEHLPDVMEALAQCTRHFIVFVDDLSFDASDPSYTGLKAMLDGSLTATPDNVLIYATSNRRHLMPEAATDNEQARVIDGELHPGEAVEEKISLSERFGIWLAFHPFSQDQYLAVVDHWTRELRAPAADDHHARALRWALRRGARNGRVAYQFVVSRLGGENAR